jgi:hypothetical protein
VRPPENKDYRQLFLNTHNKDLLLFFVLQKFEQEFGFFIRYAHNDVALLQI